MDDDDDDSRVEHIVSCLDVSGTTGRCAYIAEYEPDMANFERSTKRRREGAEKKSGE